MKSVFLLPKSTIIQETLIECNVILYHHGVTKVAKVRSSQGLQEMDSCGKGQKVLCRSVHSLFYCSIYVFCMYIQKMMRLYCKMTQIM